jgi:hypothetical protein
MGAYQGGVEDYEPTYPLIDGIRALMPLGMPFSVASGQSSHRSRGTRPASGDPTVRIPTTQLVSESPSRPRPLGPFPIPKRFHVASSPRPTGLVDSTKSERESENLGAVVVNDVKLRRPTLPRLTRLEKGENGGAPTIPPGSQSLKPSTGHLSARTLAFSYDKIDPLLPKEVSGFASIVDSPSARNLPSTAQPPTPQRIWPSRKSNLQFAKHLDPSQHGVEMSMNAKPWKPRSLSLWTFLATVLELGLALETISTKHPSLGPAGGHSQQNREPGCIAPSHLASSCFSRGSNQLHPNLLLASQQPGSAASDKRTLTNKSIIRHCSLLMTRSPTSVSGQSNCLQLPSQQLPPTQPFHPIYLPTPPEHHLISILRPQSHASASIFLINTLVYMFPNVSPNYPIPVQTPIGQSRGRVINAHLICIAPRHNTLTINRSIPKTV